MDDVSQHARIPLSFAKLCADLKTTQQRVWRKI